MFRNNVPEDKDHRETQTKKKGCWKCVTYIQKHRTAARERRSVNASSVLKDNVAPVKEGLSISTVRPIRNKGVAVDCHSKEDAQKHLSEIKKDSKLAEALDFKKPEPRFPRCVVYDILNSTENSEILGALALAIGASRNDFKVN
ncbi:hypothetical protein AVEN_27204-1 [Araneus ventricosus]|uniref:Uncharacterized protein n=1 Tax=Araneus ventricosus TaxID=182803 RepID=A0A4Y2FJT7_ARAVE|nr:hypothetical protein AVEN_27204-1 [Araneus ventricosus]